MPNENFRRLIGRAALSVACTAIALQALAAPAPWHQWSSRIDGSRVCAQTTPGPGWDYFRGPFKDASCKEALFQRLELESVRPDAVERSRSKVVPQPLPAR